MWSALTTAEKDKFLKALGDPSSELAQKLLASEDFEKLVVEPWWEHSPEQSADSVSRGLRDERIAAPRHKQFGNRPSPLNVPPTLMNASTASSVNAPSLLYNISAVLYVYGLLITVSSFN